MYILNILTDRENINRNDVPGVYSSQLPLKRLVQERLKQGLSPRAGTGLKGFEGTEGGDAGGEGRKIQDRISRWRTFFTVHRDRTT